MRSPAIVLACALALLLAACGGSESSSATGTESAATVAPASAAAYVAVDSDLDSEQWTQAQELLDRFPARARLLEEIEESLSAEDLTWEEDIDPALGPETAIVVLTGENDAVGLTQPDDQAKLDALMAQLTEGEDDFVTREIDGWTAIADTDAVLDSFERAREQGTLEDDDVFQEAVGDLPEQALVKAFIAGDALERAATEASGSSIDSLTGGGRPVSIALALEALGEGVKFSGAARLEGGTRVAAYEPALLERVPDDALAVFSFKDLAAGFDEVRQTPSIAPALGQIEQLFGLDVDDVVSLFEGETAVYVRAGSPIPEVTILLDVEDADAAMATVDRIAARAVALLGARAGSLEVDGAEVKFLDIQGIRVSYTTFDGIVALTSGPTGIRDARADGDKLSDDERFQETKEAAGMGDETNGFIYVDLADAIPLIQGFADLADEEIPPEVAENLEPLESFLAYATQDGDVVNFGGMLVLGE